MENDEEFFGAQRFTFGNKPKVIEEPKLDYSWLLEEPAEKKFSEIDNSTIEKRRYKTDYDTSEIDISLRQPDLSLLNTSKSLHEYWKRFIMEKLSDSRILGNEQVIFEGELFQVKAGVNSFYIKRWCVITTSSFRFYSFKEVSYYKGKLSAKVWETKPLKTIKLSEVVNMSKFPFS